MYKPKLIVEAMLTPSLEEHIRKASFVENELAQLLKTANPRIIDVTYGIRSDNEEVVCVTMENGYGYDINVSADSLMAIAKDVTITMLHK